MFESLKLFFEDRALIKERKLRNRKCYHYAIKFLEDAEWKKRTEEGTITHYYEHYQVITKCGIVEFSLNKTVLCPSMFVVRVNCAFAIFKGDKKKMEEMFLVLKEMVMHLPDKPKGKKK